MFLKNRNVSNIKLRENYSQNWIKCPRNGIEKYHLRKAIEVTYPGLLPDEILWRQKEAFSDGVSSFKKKSWVDVLKDHAHNLISDDNKKINNR